MELSRVEMVIGPKAVEKLNAARVAVIGLGGVGSYVAEALCRTGVGSFLRLQALSASLRPMLWQRACAILTLCAA